ncbi:MAG: sigma-70 family RNA polymerase sigma factor [Chitinophagales bacterium]|nr:sigma-70 family RNA polymerase sigma factor [Chitinophagales bacterium]
MITANNIKTDDLVMKLKARNKEAFSVLYDSYATALLGIATRIVRNQHMGEDVLQEVFVKIWRNIDSYDASKGTLFTWMLNITRNASKDYLRSKQCHNQLRITGNGLESLNGRAPSCESDYRDESHDLPRLIHKLDAKYKEVIDLVYIYGYTQIEVSKMLNIPTGTVKTRCRNAIRNLKINYAM